MNTMRKYLLVGFLSFITVHASFSQQVVHLYSGAIPGSTPMASYEKLSMPYPDLIRTSQIPTLEVYLPEKQNATGTAVVICPGGGYAVIVYQGEGVNTAKQLAKNGIAAFVLKYRLPNDSFQLDKKTAPIQDALQAIKMVRDSAAKWNVDVNKVGIMGFSAGGHLAASAATHYNDDWVYNPDKTNLRPDFQILVYPVISMQDSLTHKDSKIKLLGATADKETVKNFSNELMVNEKTPPAYITHAADDYFVDTENSIGYFQALRKNKVSAALHLYPKGGHGFIFRNANWTDPLLTWLYKTSWKN